MDQQLYDRVAEVYRGTGSVDETARICGTYPIKVRKILITEGLWKSKKSIAVNNLRERGYSVREIAEELNMEEKSVQFYLPYAGKQEDGEKETGKIRVEQFRDRNRRMAEGMMNRAGKEGKTAMTGTLNMADGNEIRKEGRMEERKKERRKEFDRGRPALPPDWRKRADAESAGTESAGLEPPAALQLRLELVGQVYGREGEAEPDCVEDIFRDEDDARWLREKIRTRGGITRDLIVPSEMSLHELNYAILESFGFQNNHLHRFALPKGLFSSVTEETVHGWQKWCGALFRFPQDSFEEIYWDDDYKEDKSPKAWKRSKYLAGRKNYGTGETFIENRRRAEDDWREEERRVGQNGREKLFEDPAYFAEYWRGMLDVGDVHDLLERLTLRELFFCRDDGEWDFEAWKEAMERRVADREHIVREISASAAWKELLEGMRLLRQLRGERAYWDKLLWEKKCGVWTEKDENPAREMEKAEEKIRDMAYRLEPLMNALNPVLLPLTDTLYYNYDFGDDWLIRITCTDLYTRNDPSADFHPENYAEEVAPEVLGSLVKKGLGKAFPENSIYLDRDGKKIRGARWRAVRRAEMEKMPSCIAAEGLPLVEDVGGIHGYFDFIRSIYRGDDETAASYREWARGLGWKGVVGKPENIL